MCKFYKHYNLDNVLTNDDCERVMHLLEDIASDHVDMLDVGYQRVKSLGLMWVLAKIHIELSPFAVREVDVATWQSSGNKYFVTREYVGTSGGNVIIRASSVWVLVSASERKIVPNDVLPAIDCCAETATDCEYIKLRVDDSFVQCADYCVQADDIDKNCHVNNSKYAKIALQLVNKPVAMLEIVFHNEVTGGNIERYVKNDGATYVIGKQNGKLCFTAVIQ